MTILNRGIGLIHFLKGNELMLGCISDTLGSVLNKDEVVSFGLSNRAHFRVYF